MQNASLKKGYLVGAEKAMLSREYTPMRETISVLYMVTTKIVFKVKVGVYYGYVLSPLLFIIALEALSCKFVSEAPWEDLFGDHLVSIAKKSWRRRG